MKEEKIININAAQILRILIADKRKICIYSCIAGVIGVILAFGTPKVYKSTVILAPEESGNGFSGSLSSLASMVGMNMKIGQTGDALYPEIYPDLLASTGFIVGLFPIQVTTKETGDHFTYGEYILKHQKTALGEYPVLWITKLKEMLTRKEKADPNHQTDPFWLTKEENDVLKAIQANIKCTVDKKTNVITIVVKDQDPLIAATIADSVQVHLQHAITDYRTKKARVDMEYMEQLYKESKQEYLETLKDYAEYADSYQNLKLQKYALMGEAKENEMQLKQAIYQQVVEQLQLAKAKVQERTPAFTTVQHATVPLKHSSRPKIVSLVLWMFLGFIVRCAMLTWKNRGQIINI